MTAPRFFLDPDALRGGRVHFPPEQSRQIARVLRLEPGQAVFVLDNTGRIYTVRLERVHPREVWGSIVGVEDAGGEPPLHVTLCVALIKGERMDWVLQKGTELGVSRFVPMVTTRTVVRRSEKRPRWQRILTEAAEQCGRAHIPEVTDIVSFDEALAATANTGLAFLAHNGEEVPRWREVAPALAERPNAVVLFVGPEGGFTEEEVALAASRGVHIVHLGPRVLRAETAAITLAALALHQWGDLG